MTRQVKIFLTVLPPPARADNAFSYVCYSCKTNKRVNTLFTHWKKVIIQPPFVKSNLTSENVSIKMPLPDRFISFFYFWMSEFYGSFKNILKTLDWPKTVMVETQNQSGNTSTSLKQMVAFSYKTRVQFKSTAVI